ncbi:hypothetical protein EOM09_07870 [bacterium]|nr:hypothetical protein [bacterium]
MKVLRSIDDIIIIDIAINVINSAANETSLNIKNERIIVKVLLTLVYGIINEIFSSLYIFWYSWVLNIQIRMMVMVEKISIESIFSKSSSQNSKKYTIIRIHVG